MLTRQIADDRPWRALFEYLEASGRLESMTDTMPLWARHDSGAPGPHELVTSRAFVNNLKHYCAEAGIGDVWLHQTRHTVASHLLSATFATSRTTGN